jgi:hypothetical protein
LRDRKKEGRKIEERGGGRWSDQVLSDLQVVCHHEEGLNRAEREREPAARFITVEVRPDFCHTFNKFENFSNSKDHLI